MRALKYEPPETVDPRKLVEYFGVEASAFTKSLLDGKTVELERDPDNANRDHYNRLLRYVWLDGVLVNAEIIAQGYGFAYVKYPFSRMEEFRALERQARQAERGLWAPEATPKSVLPASAQASPDTIVYVTATGSKYHLEGCRQLARSMIPILMEAAAARYEPGGVCRPPRL